MRLFPEMQSRNVFKGMQLPMRKELKVRLRLMLFGCAV